MLVRTKLSVICDENQYVYIAGAPPKPNLLPSKGVFTLETDFFKKEV